MQLNTVAVVLCALTTCYFGLGNALPLAGNNTGALSSCASVTCEADIGGTIVSHCCTTKIQCCHTTTDCCNYGCTTDGKCKQAITTTPVSAPGWQSYILGARCVYSSENCKPVTLDIGKKDQTPRIANGDTSHGFPLIINRAGVRYNQGAYLIGGESLSGYTGRVDFLDNESPTATTSTTLPVEISGAAAAVDSSDNIVVYGGQFHNQSHSSDVYSFDGSNWKPITKLPFDLTRVDHTMTTVDGTVYVIGGTTAEGDLSKNVIGFSDNKWTKKTDCTVPIAQHSAVATDDSKILVCGGLQDNQPSSNCYVYDPRGDSWSDAKRMLYPRKGHIMVRRDNTYYIIGGGIHQVERYDVETGGKLTDLTYDNAHTVAVPLQ